MKKTTKPQKVDPVLELAKAINRLADAVSATPRSIGVTIYPTYGGGVGASGGSFSIMTTGGGFSGGGGGRS